MVQFGSRMAKTTKTSRLSLIEQMGSLLNSILLRFDMKFIHCIKKERKKERQKETKTERDEHIPSFYQILLKTTFF